MILYNSYYIILFLHYMFKQNFSFNLRSIYQIKSRILFNFLKFALNIGRKIFKLLKLFATPFISKLYPPATHLILHLQNREKTVTHL